MVLDVLRDRPPEMPIPDRNQSVQAFFVDRTKRSAYALGARTGVETTRIPASRS
jgi:hypothetical protein